MDTLIVLAKFEVRSLTHSQDNSYWSFGWGANPQSWVRGGCRGSGMEDFRPMWSWSTNVTDRQTDGQTTCDRNTALCTKVHRAVKILTRNTLDCDQSNVYSSRDIFSSISPNLPLCSFSLYFIIIFDWLATLSCKISDQSPITCVNSHYRVRGQSMVCVHT